MSTIKTAGGVVLGPGGTIALVKTIGGNGALLFPKGHVEEGEDDETAARREIQEETGLTDLELLDDLGTYERPRIDISGMYRQDEMKSIHMFLFAAHQTTLTPSHEIAEALWVPHREAASFIGNEKDRSWFASVFERVREAIQRD